MAVELSHGYSWKSGGGVVFSFVLVNLVDGNGGVNNGWLNSLLLDDGLDVLVDMVVDVLSCNGWGSCGGVLGLADGTGVFELSCLGGKTLLDVRVVAVLDVAVLNVCHLVVVLLGKNFTVLDGLN